MSPHRRRRVRSLTTPRLRVVLRRGLRGTSRGTDPEFDWCRRRDSNSHSFRHYPLKIACLPISPRRLGEETLSGTRLRLSAPARFPYCFKPCILPQSEAFVQCTKKNLMLRGALKTQTVRRDRYIKLLGHSGRGSCGRTSSRSRGRRCRCRGRNRCDRAHHTRRHTALAGADQRQRQRGNEKHGSQHGRRTRQEVGRAGCAEQATRRTGAKGRPNVGALAVL